MDIENIINEWLETGVLGLEINGKPIEIDQIELRKKKVAKKKDYSINLTDDIKFNYSLSFNYNIIIESKESIDINIYTKESKEIEDKVKDNLIELKFDDMANKLASIYNNYNYGSKWHRTVTMKKIVSLVNNSNRKKRLNPNQIIYAYTAYLAEMANLEREVQYIKGSDAFITNYLYDYIERTKPLYEQKMEEKYGSSWKKLRFRIID